MRVRCKVLTGAVAALALAACSPGERSDEAPTPAANNPALPTVTGEPATAAAAEPAAPSRADRVKDWVRAEYADLAPVMVCSGEVDLDGDGAPEVLAYVGGPMVCGTGGCELVVLKDDGAAFTKVSGLSVTQLPVGVLDTKTRGWRDLAVTVHGGGVKGRVMKVPFDGTRYARNPTVAPATETAGIGTEIIADGELEPLQ